jgi:hypothetical protein
VKATVLYRIAAAIFALFAAGHTIGFLISKSPRPRGLAVRASVNAVRFQIARDSYSYGDFYLGFGLFVTAFQLFSAFLAWLLSSWARNSPPAIRSLARGSWLSKRHPSHCPLNLFFRDADSTFRAAGHLSKLGWMTGQRTPPISTKTLTIEEKTK